MVTTRAAMESRIEVLEREMDEVRRGLGEVRQHLDALTGVPRQLEMLSGVTSRLEELIRGGNTRRFHEEEGEHHARRSRSPTSERNERSQSRRCEASERRSYDEWGEPGWRRPETGRRLEIPLFLWGRRLRMVGESGAVFPCERHPRL